MIMAPNVNTDLKASINPPLLLLLLIVN